MPEYIEREALLQVLEELEGWDDPLVGGKE